MLQLKFKDNRHAPIWLADEHFTIGQDKANDLRLTGKGVSPFHAEIQRQQTQYFLLDSGSEKGTFVNGERIHERYQIRHKDTLTLGGLDIQVFDPNRSSIQQAVQSQWFIQVLQGENAGKKYALSGSMTFGRSVKCELSFNHDELSRRHCEFFIKNNELAVKDLGSSNGVYLNHKKVTTAKLQPGDQLQMGKLMMLVIGPKVESSEDVLEDATLYIPQPARNKKTAVKSAEPKVPENKKVFRVENDAVAPPPGNNRSLWLLGAVLIAGLSVFLMFV